MHACSYSRGMRSPFSPILTPQFPVCQPYMRIQPAFAGTFRAFYADEQLRRRADSARVFNIRLRKVPLANTVRRTYNRHRSRCARVQPGGWALRRQRVDIAVGRVCGISLVQSVCVRVASGDRAQATSAPRMFGRPRALPPSDVRTQSHRPSMYMGWLPAQCGSMPVASGGPYRQAPRPAAVRCTKSPAHPHI